MLNNWHKKERPFLSLTSTTGGAGGFASGGAGGLWQWDGDMVPECSTNWAKWT